MRLTSLEVEKTPSSTDYFNGIEYGIRNNKKYSKHRGRPDLRIIKNYEDYSDIELVDSFIFESDDLAFNEIFNRYYEKVMRLALKKLTDIDEAEDIVQEVFVTLVQKMDSFRGDSKFSTWLYAITLNTIKMRLREKIRNRRYISIDEDYNVNSMDRVVSNASNNGGLNSPEEIFVNNEFIENLNRALDLIPEKYKEAFILRDLNQLSNQEIADQLGLTLSAVKSRVHRARQYLQTNFGDYQSLNFNR